jgi:hypothetical protein
MFSDTKGVIRCHKSKNDNTTAKRKGTKRQTKVHKMLHRKLKIGQRKSDFKPSNYTILWNMIVFLINKNTCLNRY